MALSKFVNYRIIWRLSIIFGVISFLNLGQLAAQTTKITGFVADSMSQKALVYASVQLKNKSLGTITNAEGRFLISIPKLYTNDSLLFSFLGYETQVIAIQNLLQKDSIILLSEKHFSLTEVDITGYSPVKIVEKCITNFSENYYQKPIMLSAYFREFITDNGHLEKYSEAQLKIVKESYLTKKKDIMQFVDGVTHKTKSLSPIWEYIYFVNGTYEALRCDAVKYNSSFIIIPSGKLNFLSLKHLKHYYYHVSYETDDQIYIDFRPKSKRATFKGQLIIEKSNYALIGYFYYVPPPKLEFVSLMRFDTERYLEEENIETYSINYYAYAIYQKIEGKYILHHSGLSYQMIFISSPKQILSSFSVSSQLLITSYDKNEAPIIPWLKRVKHAESVHKQISKISNNDFKSLQIVVPEKSIKQFLEQQNN